MKSTIYYLIFVVAFLLSISSASADTWRIFTYGVTYADGNITPQGIIPPDRNIVQAFRLPNANTLCIMSTGNPITIGPKAALTTEYDNDFAELQLRFNSISTSAIGADGTFYIQAVNGIAYLDKTTNKWLGYNTYTQFNNSVLPDIPLENLFCITTDMDNHLFITGTKEGRPAVATLTDNEWVLTVVDHVLLNELKKAEQKADQAALGFKNFEEQSLPESFIFSSPVLGADGSVWILPGSKGYRPAIIFKDGLFRVVKGNYSTIISDKEKNMFLASRESIEMICAKTDTRETILKEGTRAMVVENGVLWFETNVEIGSLTSTEKAYLTRYNIETERVTRFKTSGSPIDFPLIWLHSDSQGNLAMTTGHSLYLIDRKDMSKYEDKWEYYPIGHLDELEFLKYFHTGMSRGGLYPTSVSWRLGEHNNRLVGILKEGQWDYYKMEVEKEARLIMGMRGTEPISACYTTKGIFIGTGNDGLMCFDPAAQKASNVEGYDIKRFDKTVRTIAEDKNGVIWLGTDKGLVKYDGVDFQLYNKKSSDFKSNKVNSLYVSPNNILWIGSGDGIFSFDGTTWKQYGKNEGMKATNVYRITGVGETVYATTFALLKSSNNLYTIENGVLTSEELPFKIWKDGVMVDENNCLWIIGQSAGIICRKPDGTSKTYNASNSPVGFSGKALTLPQNFIHAYCGGGKLYVEMHETSLQSTISDEGHIKSLIDHYKEKVNTFNRIIVYVMDIDK